MGRYEQPQATKGSQRASVASKKKVPIGQFFSDGRRVDEAVKSGARKAVLLHERRNAPLVVWRNGKVALVPPDELKRVLRGKKK